MNKIFSLTIAIVVAALALLIATTLMTIDNKLAQRDIKIISEHPTVEELLAAHKDVIGNDYEAYKGHIYRVLTYSIHILGTKGPIDIIAAALVYHDIGLWTDKMLNYIEPSVERAKKDLPGRYNKSDMKRIMDIIYWHHKITPVEEKDPKAKKIINAVRRADWIDATMGMVHSGMPRAHIVKVEKSIANAGFHRCLLEFGPRLRGWNVYAIVTELSSILRL